MRNVRLAHAWLVFSILWIHGGYASFEQLSGASGSGSGGALLVLPFCAIAILLGALGVLVALQLDGGGRKLGMMVSIAGLVSAAISVPLFLFTFIFLMVLFGSGNITDALALCLAPLLFGYTVVVLLRAPAPPLPFAVRVPGLAIAGIAGVVLAIAPQVIQRLNPPDPPLTNDEKARYEKAVLDEDEAILAEPKAWRAYYDVESSDGLGGTSGGDILELAISKEKPRAVRALVKNKAQSAPNLHIDDALMWGSPAVLQALADSGARLATDDEIAPALRCNKPASIEFVLAHGARPDAVLCMLCRLPGINSDGGLSKLALVLGHGADPNARCGGDSALATATSSLNTPVADGLRKAGAR